MHSENETDQAKRGVRACTLDLLLDLVPIEPTGVIQHRPKSTLGGPEAAYLRVIARWFLRVGHLQGPWEGKLLADLRKGAFLAV